MTASPAALRAHVRFRLAVGGIAQRCPACDAAPGIPCARNPRALLCDREWKPEPEPYSGYPVVCSIRALAPGSTWRTAIENGLRLCRTDADFDAFHADLEPMRIAHYPDVTTPEPTLGPAALVGAS